MKRILIFLFLFAIPGAWGLSDPMMYNESFDDCANWTLGGGATCGSSNLQITGTDQYGLFDNSLPDMDPNYPYQ